MPKSDLKKILGFIGFGGLVAAAAIVFTVRDAVKSSEQNSSILSCDNLIAHNVRQADSHWLTCLAYGNRPWDCRRKRD